MIRFTLCKRYPRYCAGYAKIWQNCKDVSWRLGFHQFISARKRLFRVLVKVVHRGYNTGERGKWLIHYRIKKSRFS